MTEQFVPLIEKLGVRSKKPLAIIAKLQDKWKERIHDNENDEDDFEEEVEPVVENKYAWRKRVAPSKTRYANPYEYETPEEFEKAVAIGISKFEEEQVTKRRSGYTEENVCRFCKVDVMSPSKWLLYYFTGDLELSVGDEVIVPFGNDNKEVKGMVVSLGMCYASIFPFSIEKMKTVIKVLPK